MLSQKFILIIFLLMVFSGCDREQKAWELAVNLNTSSAYAAYLEKYKHGAHSDKAKLRLEDFKEKEDWGLTVNSNSASTYGAYISKYKHGAHLEEAKLRFEELTEEEDWDHIRNKFPNKDAIAFDDALIKFRSDHPDSKRLAELDVLSLGVDTKRLLAIQSGLWRDTPLFRPDSSGDTLALFVPGTTIRIHGNMDIDPIIDNKVRRLATFADLVNVAGVAVKVDKFKTNEKGITYIFATMKVSVLVHGKTVMLLYFNLSDKNTELAQDYTHWAVVKGKKYCIPRKEAAWRAEDTSNGVCVGSFGSENSKVTKNPDKDSNVPKNMNKKRRKP